MFVLAKSSTKCSIPALSPKNHWKSERKVRVQREREMRKEIPLKRRAQHAGISKKKGNDAG